MQNTVPGPPPAPDWTTDPPTSELTLVQVAERLERVTAWIEAERAKEREARAAYKAVADRVENNIREIRAYAESLLQEQRSRMASFSGLIEPKAPPFEPHADGEGEGNGAQQRDPGAPARRTFVEALMAVWALDEFRRPLTSEQILEGLERIGYETKAHPRSFRSALNQALARLCKEGKVLKFRLDGSRIPDVDRVSRARRYMAAALAGGHD